MLVSIVSLLVAVIGALVFLAAKDKVSEMGRLAFLVGLLWLVYAMATKTVRIG